MEVVRYHGSRNRCTCRAGGRETVFLAALFIAVSGCGAQTALPPPYRPAAAFVPRCIAGTRPVPLASGFPTSLPLPKRTFLISASRIPSGYEVNGFVPSSSFDDTVRQLTDTFSQAGYQAAQQEAQPPRDAESLFSGNGYTGQWKLRRVDRCTGVLGLDILIQKSG